MDSNIVAAFPDLVCYDGNAVIMVTFAMDCAVCEAVFGCYHTKYIASPIVSPGEAFVVDYVVCELVFGCYHTKEIAGTAESPEDGPKTCVLSHFDHIPVGFTQESH